MIVAGGLVTQKRKDIKIYVKKYQKEEEKK